MPALETAITLVTLVALAVALGIGYWLGRRRATPTPMEANGHSGDAGPTAATIAVETTATLAAAKAAEAGAKAAEAKATQRVSELTERVAELGRELAMLRSEGGRLAAEAAGSAALASERPTLFAELAAARAETARFRQIVIDLENDAPPPLLGGRGMPDDLKLIVGVGPVLERMLYQLGITTYRQIANWTDQDIDDIDSRLHEFPGRIRRDAWVTQARALHQSKYGSAPVPRERT